MILTITLNPALDVTYEARSTLPTLDLLRPLVTVTKESP